jgi:uncharacterized OsmC-like protein
MHPIEPNIDGVRISGAAMTTENISNAMQRVRAVLARRPEAGIHADEPAIARWDGGMRVATRHENGTQVTTDMPVQLGGTGDQVTPGWLFRAGLASCLATRIAMEAAVAAITLTRLEVLARSTSNARGLLGMTDNGDKKVTPAPYEVQLEVRIGAHNVARERLRAMIEHSFQCSPVSAAVETPVPVGLRIDFDPD